MCQLTLSNLGDETLNKNLAVILMSIGSTVHNHGWGVAGIDEGFMKCQHPAYWTTDFGNEVSKINVGKSPLLGHVRKASLNVPVTLENAHPFMANNVKLAHNGTLEYRDTKDRILKTDWTHKRYNNTTKKMETITEEVKISDSILFFNELTSAGEINSEEEFVSRLNSTMELFHGKFAFLIHLQNLNQHYVVRGKSAGLYISYMLASNRENARVLGYVVNTDAKLLDLGCSLLSNLNQVNGGKELFFSVAEEVEKESIFRANKLGLMKIGEIKETSAPTNYQPWTGGVKSTTTVTPSAREIEKYANRVFGFMQEYCISDRELQLLFLLLYGESLQEVTEKEVKHFCKKVIPRFASLVHKKVRKAINKESNGVIGTQIYTRKKKSYIFPWMLNAQEDQTLLLEELKKGV